MKKYEMKEWTRARAMVRKRQSVSALGFSPPVTASTCDKRAPNAAENLSPARPPYPPPPRPAGVIARIKARRKRALNGRLLPPGAISARDTVADDSYR